LQDIGLAVLASFCADAVVAAAVLAAAVLAAAVVAATVAGAAVVGASLGWAVTGAMHSYPHPLLQHLASSLQSSSYLHSSF